MAFPPPTPPSSAPTSPKSQTSSDGDCIIDIGGDEEKECTDEKHLPFETEKAQSPSINTGETPSQTFSDRVKNCIPTLTAKLPHVRRPFRKDGRAKFIECIDDHPRGYPKDELAEMENTLLAMDDEDVDLDPLALQSRRLDGDRTEEPSRASLIEKIDTKLKQYGIPRFEI
ncbi:MAG: hypothetical protein Q9212_005926 [Teloschistes hypoglaucus]